MKHWQETAEILSEVVAQARAGRRTAVATVVRISGSAYRRPGAKLVVRAGGETSGGVSGGCLEADVRERALGAMRDGAPQLVHYETGSDDRQPFGLGLGCNGAVDIFVQAATPAFLDGAQQILAALDGEAPFAISTVLAGDGAGRVTIRGGGEVPAETAVQGPPGAEVFDEVLAPPPRLVVIGAGDDAIPLVRYAAEAGFRVVLVDHRPAFLSAERFPGEVRRLLLRPEDAGAAVPSGRDVHAVVKTHNLGLDREWIRRLLASEVAYVGVLGPRSRIEEILRQLGAAAADDARVYGPIGLDLGADGPEQVALSVVAELLAVRAGRRPAHLRGRKGAIHGA
jgi:xanthine/CO dehydrogenase XdhC/CoxF family maturation factor